MHVFKKQNEKKQESENDKKNVNFLVCTASALRHGVISFLLFPSSHVYFWYDCMTRRKGGAQ
jgi:hypothetical protein